MIGAIFGGLSSRLLLGIGGLLLVAALLFGVYRHGVAAGKRSQQPLIAELQAERLSLQNALDRQNATIYNLQQQSKAARAEGRAASREAKQLAAQLTTLRERLQAEANAPANPACPIPPAAREAWRILQ